MESAMAQADWPLLILQPMRLLAQYLNNLVHCLLYTCTAAHYQSFSETLQLLYCLTFQIK